MLQNLKLWTPNHSFAYMILKTDNPSKRILKQTQRGYKIIQSDLPRTAKMITDMWTDQ